MLCTEIWQLSEMDRFVKRHNYQIHTRRNRLPEYPMSIKETESIISDLPENKIWHSDYITHEL